MSTLVITELFNGVTFSQDIRVKRSINLAHIRPWIYKEGTLQDGTFRLEVWDGATLLKTINILYTDLNAAFTEDYAHGYIRFDMDPLSLVVNDTEVYHVYTLKFSMVGYTTNLTNYIAICREWDIKKYITYGTTPPNDMVEPAGYEIYHFDRR